MLGECDLYFYVGYDLCFCRVYVCVFVGSGLQVLVFHVFHLYHVGSHRCRCSLVFVLGLVLVPVYLIIPRRIFGPCSSLVMPLRIGLSVGVSHYTSQSRFIVQSSLCLVGFVQVLMYLIVPHSLGPLCKSFCASQDRSKCQCIALTIEATTLTSENKIDHNAGYHHRRLHKPLFTGYDFVMLLQSFSKLATLVEAFKLVVSAGYFGLVAVAIVNGLRLFQHL